MKFEKLIKLVISFSLVAIIVAFCSLTAFAADLDGDGFDDETGAPVAVATEPEQVYTEPVYTEPIVETTVYVEPTTEYVAPVETIAPTEPVTERQEEQPTQAKPEKGNKNNKKETEFVPPTVAKTVSEKKYETNNTAGMVSWICVGVGVLVVVFVIISTKVGGRKAKRKRI